MRLTEPDLETSRLRLRRWQPEDAEDLARAWHDPGVRAGGAVPAVATVETARRWISGWDDRAAAGSALDLVVGPSAPGRAVWGEVGLGPISWDRRTAEVGYWMAAEQRCRGLASEAVALLTGWALRHLPLDRVIARTAPDDRPSTAVLVRCGFVHRGRLPSGLHLWACEPTPPGAIPGVP